MGTDKTTMAAARYDQISPPAPALRRPLTRTAHGVEFADDWAWLKADNWRDVLKDPAVLPDDIRAVLDAENTYAEAVLAPLTALRAALAAEMRGRVREDDTDVPLPDGPFEYYNRFRAGGEHEIVCRRRRDGGPEEILLDGDALAKGKSFFELGGAAVSLDHRLLAWSVDDKGSEFHSIHVRDLATATDLPDAVPDTEGGDSVWSDDATAFYYVRLDANHRPIGVFRHILGADPAGDAGVYMEADPSFFVHVKRSRDRRFAVIAISDHDSAEARLVELREAGAAPRLAVPRESGRRCEVEPHGDKLFILTNADGAEDFRLVEAPLATPEKPNWRDVVPHRPGRMIVRFTVFARHLVRLERENGLPRIVVRDIATGHEHDIAFDEEAYSLSLEPSLEFDTDVMRFAYSSMTTPREIFDYDMATRERVLRKRQEVPSGHDPKRYATRRLMIKAPDGEDVPVSLLHRADAKLDGTGALFITGYGAYGHASPASFSTRRLSLVDRGFVFAIAHVRGGADKGWRWYANGKLEHKPNTFGDFIAATKGLVERGVAAPGRVVASGGSAGGMLMGAIANMAPELYAGIVADVPFVDVVNTMMDASLPLTPPEWLEWGNPIEDATAFKAMLAYSPYDNVGAKKYPAILALAGLTDPRVTYWEPAKWVARLRATMTAGGPALLKTNMAAGHGGASGRFDSLAETALEYAFALACAGLGEAPADWPRI